MTGPAGWLVCPALLSVTAVAGYAKERFRGASAIELRPDVLYYIIER